MLKLIRLEFEKTKFGGYVWSALATIAALILLSLVILIVPAETGEEVVTMKAMLQADGALVQSSFIVFASVVLARLVIEEYRSKTIQMLFTYPVHRKKLLAAKLIIVASWTFITIIIATLILSLVSIFVNHTFDIVDNDVTKSFLYEHTIKTAAMAVAAAGMSMVPLFFGMLRKSVPATIVSAIVMISLLNSSSGNGFNFNSIVVIPIAFACVGVAVAWISIRKIETADI